MKYKHVEIIQLHYTLFSSVLYSATVEHHPLASSHEHNMRRQPHLVGNGNYSKFVCSKPVQKNNSASARTHVFLCFLQIQEVVNIGCQDLPAY